MGIKEILKYLKNNFRFELDKILVSEYTPCINLIGKINNEKVFIKTICKEEIEQNYLIYKEAGEYGIEFLFPEVIHYNEERSLLILEYIEGRKAEREDIPKIMEIYSKIKIEDSSYKNKFAKRLYYWLIERYKIPINFNKIEESIIKREYLELCIWDASLKHYIIKNEKIIVIDPKNLLGVSSFDYGNLYVETLDSRLIKSNIFFYLGILRKILKKERPFHNCAMK